MSYVLDVEGINNLGEHDKYLPVTFGQDGNELAVCKEYLMCARTVAPNDHPAMTEYCRNLQRERTREAPRVRA